VLQALIQSSIDSKRQFNLGALLLNHLKFIKLKHTTDFDMKISNFRFGGMWVINKNQVTAAINSTIKKILNGPHLHRYWKTG